MIQGVFFDLDGTVYRGEKAVPGAPELIRRLKREGRRYLFLTNRSNRTPAQIASQLEGYGVPCRPEDILTSAQATARYLRRGSVFYVGDEGLREAIETANLRITDHDPDYVVVGFTRDFTYQHIEKASRLIREGAKFVATNSDEVLCTDEGLSPGTGALVAAVAVASGREPVFVGKPQTVIIDMGLERVGLRKEDVIIVGDNLDRDIKAGENAGIRTVLILTGISSREDLDGRPTQPTWVVEDYRELERLLDHAR